MMVDSHAVNSTRGVLGRGVNCGNRGGRPSVRAEERIAANMDVIAVTSDVESEIEALLRAEGRELRHCQRLEHDLCNSMCRTRAIHERLASIRADRRRANAALCNGEIAAL